ncbi:MAG: hypothetical protein QM541_06920 [Flavobacterium sp.]|nr:hypothetical protein [Flavobacterium sp.]
MLRDNINTYHAPSANDLNTEASREVKTILTFIDRNISEFPVYYLANKDSDKENRISDFLVYHFNACLCDEMKEGFFPFNFGKNPTQEASDKETDIGVVILTRGAKPITIIEFEAKRLSNTSANHQYVYGENRGGIERFKLKQHGGHLSICGMFGYVQNDSCITWIEKINGWIFVKSKEEFTGNQLSWAYEYEKVQPIKSLNEVEKCISKHRRNDNSTIILHHYFIKLY